MKKFGLKTLAVAAVFALGAAAFSAAAEEAVDKAFITLDDGSTITLDLPTLDRMEVREGIITFRLNDGGEDFSCSFENFREMTFEVHEDTGIDGKRVAGNTAFEIRGSRLLLNTGVGVLTVYDLQGKAIRTLTAGSASQEINLSTLPGGVYVVVYSDGSHNQQVCKIII